MVVAARNLEFEHEPPCLFHECFFNRILLTDYLVFNQQFLFKQILHAFHVFFEQIELFLVIIHSAFEQHLSPLLILGPVFLGRLELILDNMQFSFEVFDISLEHGYHVRLGINGAIQLVYHVIPIIQFLLIGHESFSF